MTEGEMIDAWHTDAVKRVATRRRALGLAHPVADQLLAMPIDGPWCPACAKPHELSAACVAHWTEHCLCVRSAVAVTNGNVSTCMICKGILCPDPSACPEPVVPVRAPPAAHVRDMLKQLGGMPEPIKVHASSARAERRRQGR